MVIILAFYIMILINSNEVSDKSVDEIIASCENLIDLDSAEKKGYQELKQYYGLNEGDLEGYAYYGPISMMDVTEVLIVKTFDSSQCEDIEDAIEKRLSEQKNNFNGYGTNQMDLLNHSVIKTKGNYVFFAVAENADEIAENFLKAIKK
jgi:hypothetical protein